MAVNSLIWRRDTTPAELCPLLECLESEYDVHSTGRGLRLEFEKMPTKPRVSSCKRVPGGYKIGYSDIGCAARALGSALAGMENDEVTTTFKTLGIMLDVSRASVPTIAGAKRFMLRSALLGYNLVMLYDEDVFKLPDEPYFGYMRGAYSVEEIQEIDDYAVKLGVEVCGCIQMLAHFQSMLAWDYYADIKDTASVILVDEPKTYKLLEKVIAFWKKALRNRRIHIGMDEAWDLGRGQLLDRNGKENGFDIFNRHLARVMDICKKAGLEPMIWGDMYFRLSNARQEYYATDTVFPPEVKTAVPKGVQLVYWDYYTTEEPVYRDMIKLHRELTDKPVIVASGLWTWDMVWSDRTLCEVTVKPCIDACVKENVDELIFTLWQNEASICPIESSFCQLAWAADLCCGFEDKKRTGKRFAAICHANYQAHVEASLMNMELYDPSPLPLMERPWIKAKTNLLIAIGDDPLLAIGFNNMKLIDAEFDTKTIAHLKKQLAKILPYADDHEAGDIAHAINIARLVIAKLEVRRMLEDAYDLNDRGALRELADVRIPAARECALAFWKTFRAQWIKFAKPFGMECTQSEIFTVIARLEELRERVYEYLDGKAESIPELDERLPLNTPHFIPNAYRHIKTAFKGR